MVDTTIVTTIKKWCRYNTYWKINILSFFYFREKYEQNQREQAAWKKKNSKYDVTAYPNYQPPQRNIGTPEEPFWVPAIPPYGK